MDVYELSVDVRLRKDIYYLHAQEVLSNFIFYSMLLDDNLKSLHKENMYKNYVFGNFYPIEKVTRTYKAGKHYTFRFRTLDGEIANRFLAVFQEVQDRIIKVTNVSMGKIPNRKISELYTINPLIVTIDDGPWLQGDNVEVFKTRLIDNLEKKYSEFFGESVCADDFIKLIRFMNRTPVATQYKGVKLLGHKVKIEIGDSTAAQQLARVAIGTGLGEKGSLGFGFALPNYI